MANDLPEPQRPGLPEGRRVLAVVGGGILIAVGVAIVIGKAANYTRMMHFLRGADPGWLGLCVAGEIVAYGGFVAAFRVAAGIAGGVPLSVRTAVRVVAASFGGLVLATGAGALAVLYWAIHRAGVDAQRALSRVLALHTLNWATLGTAATLASIPALLGAGPDVPLGMPIGWIVVVTFCITGALLATSGGRAEQFTQPTGGRIRRAFAAAIGGVVLVRAIVRTRRVGILGAACYWAGDMACLWAALHAFGGHVGMPAMLLAYASGYVATLLPLPVGGAGGVDAAMTYSLTLVGVPLAPALLGVFAYRLFNFWLPMLPALAVLPTVRGLARELPDAAAPARG